MSGRIAPKLYEAMAKSKDDHRLALVRVRRLSTRAQRQVDSRTIEQQLFTAMDDEEWPKALSNQTGPTDEQVRLLLVLYRCPVPFHIVRTRIFGSIASPELDVSPIEAVKSLWGEELPELKSTASLNALMEVLVKGLWNRLARHQKRRAPFHLLRIDVPLDREGLAQLALFRREELEGFMEGLFGHKKEFDLPERTYRALGQLSEDWRVPADASRRPL